MAEPGGQTRRAANPRATHRREGELVCDLPIVFVPLLHLRLPSRQVAADETEAGAVELKADAHRALIARLSPHASLHGVDGHVPVTKEHRGMATPTQNEVTPTSTRPHPLRKLGDHRDWLNPMVLLTAKDCPGGLPLNRVCLEGPGPSPAPCNAADTSLPCLPQIRAWPSSSRNTIAGAGS